MRYLFSIAFGILFISIAGCLTYKRPDAPEASTLLTASSPSAPPRANSSSLPVPTREDVAQVGAPAPEQPTYIAADCSAAI